MTVDAEIGRRGVLARAWALNEASLERTNRERMLEIEVAVDGRPLLRFGCDGVLCATPDRLDGVRVLRRRPDRMAQRRRPDRRAQRRPRPVRPPDRRGARLRPSTSICSAQEHDGVLSCDGRRSVAVPAGARVAYEGRPGPHRAAGRWSFADRLVTSSSCRSAASATATRSHSTSLQVVLEELRIRGLGVIDDAVLPLGPGLTVLTGETGAGKTMVVTALLLLFGNRADSARVRTGPRKRSSTDGSDVAAATTSGSNRRRVGR